MRIQTKGSIIALGVNKPLSKAIKPEQAYTEKKVEPKRRVEPFWKTVPPWKWHQNSATGGAELRTMKWLQGWSRFGSTFFLSVSIFTYLIVFHKTHEMPKIRRKIVYPLYPILIICQI